MVLDFDNPVLQTLVSIISVAYGFQLAFSIPCIIYQEDRFYGDIYLAVLRLTSDFSGSFTYLGCTALSLYLPSLRARSLSKFQGLPPSALPSIRSFHPRQIILSAMVVVWTMRLG